MLTKRLTQIVSLLPRCKVLADIGCDHGYVGIAALEQGIAEQVVFSDISAPSLNKARQNCPQGLQTRAQFVHCNGFSQIPVDCAVIAGMGGLEIISVLDGAESLPRHLVLQPMRNQSDVRTRLTKQYKILYDTTFFDGKFYDLILAEKCDGGSTLSHLETVFGTTNLHNPSADFVAYLNKEHAKYSKILQQCNVAEAVQRMSDINRAFATIMEEPK